MTKTVNDALLPITRVLLLAGEWVFAGLGVFIAGIGTITAATIGFGFIESPPEFTKDLPNVPVEQIAGGIFGFTLIIAILLFMLWQFIRRLRQIVQTVDTDPFVRANAKRLREMGWIALISFIPGMVLVAMGSWFDTMAEKGSGDISIEGGVDVGQFILILLLFILARVFERGADMREELEGTV
jgi:Protein of unknown function (DUF2975)